MSFITDLFNRNKPVETKQTEVTDGQTPVTEGTNLDVLATGADASTATTSPEATSTPETPTDSTASSIGEVALPVDSPVSSEPDTAVANNEAPNNVVNLDQPPVDAQPSVETPAPTDQPPAETQSPADQPPAEQPPMAA